METITPRSYINSPSFRLVARWQVYVTFACALLSSLWVGLNGALSAALGGAIVLIAGYAYARVVSLRRKPQTAGAALRALFHGEAAKIFIIVILLFLVMKFYKELVVISFFSAFVITTALSSIALLARDN